MPSEKLQVLAACESLHMHLTGSSDCWSDDKAKATAKELSWRLETWMDSPAFSRKYDDAVKALVVAVLAEYREREIDRATAGVPAGETK